MTGRRTSRRLSSQIHDIVEDVLEEKENSRRNTRKSIKPKSSAIDEVDEEPNVSPVKKPRRERALSTKAMENMALDVSDILEENESPLRKSTRTRKSKKLDDGHVYESPSDKQKRKSVETIAVPDDDEEEDIEAPERPETLFTEEMDVAGSQMFGFKTPKKRDGMSLLAQNTPKTPQNMTNTPKSRRAAMKTPSHVRSKIKEKLTKMSLVDDSDEDFSSDHSDYNPDSSSSSSEDEENSPKSDTSDTEKRPVTKMAISFPVTPSVSTRNRRKDVQYVLESDVYFNSHASAKVTTSNHTLDRLKNPRLEHDKLFKLLSEMQLTNAHETSIKAMNEEYRLQFSKWIYLFNEGFNIVLHGLGSKRNLLNLFHKEILADKPVIVINGFFPSLTLKDVLDAIVVDILEVSTAGTAQQELLVDLIETEFKKIPETHLFLLIHNLDGGMLRNDRAQSVLSRLAAIQNIHLIATIDHINTPLLWDYSKLTNYNFIWWDCTTMLPYKDETAYENSMLIQNSGALALSSMANVFLSLTHNGRGIYMIIVQSQLNNKGNPNYQGMAFKDLYSSCRENFLVSSDLALRAQLTEFLDHKMVKIKRSNDGTEYLNIPIEYGLLTQFMEEQEK